uniref:Uncharacterized protein Mb2253c n=1 Tax=Anthurium amnicola TaxID=1678845 RepID=A0A1D1YW85_9ARAE
MRSSLRGMSFAAWRRSICNVGIRVNTLNFMLIRFHIQCFSARCISTSRRRKVEPPQSKKDTGEFYVVRKGDLVGVYKSFTECQKQLSASVCDPAVSVYKGHSLCKETEEYLASHGLKNAIYSINSVDVKDNLFGTLIPCPFQDVIGPRPTPADLSTEHHNLLSCILEFDGASKGNPGKSGAGVILRSEDGTVISRLREGLGVATNNAAEYRAVILGMKYALKKGFKQILIQGDSKLVCNQVNGTWRTKHKNLINLNKEAKELRDKFLSFTVRHVKRAFNSDADAEANGAVELPDGEVYEESGGSD